MRNLQKFEKYIGDSKKVSRLFNSLRNIGCLIKIKNAKQLGEGD